MLGRLARVALTCLPVPRDVEMRRRVASLMILFGFFLEQDEDGASLDTRLLCRERLLLFCGGFHVGAVHNDGFK